VTEGFDVRNIGNRRVAAEYNYTQVAVAVSFQMSQPAHGIPTVQCELSFVCEFRNDNDCRIFIL